MIYTPNNLNLQPRTVWQIDTGDGETEIEFSWNPKGSMVIVSWPPMEPTVSLAKFRHRVTVGSCLTGD